jgi:prepilin-type N-terminal cleavage/methylation domain-containing protein
VRCGFTLIEILAVVAIVAICLSIFRIIGSYRDSSIKDNVARSELALLNCTIEFFKSKNGFYPTCDAASVVENAKSLHMQMEPLMESAVGAHRWKVVNGMLVDPWNNPYVYRCKSKDSLAYILFSMGPNGHIDEEQLIDDIYSR